MALSAKSISPQLYGSFPAIVTPMKKNGDLDMATFTKLINWQIEQGTNGIVVLGTTGESPTVESDEFATVVKTAIDATAGRVPIIVGTGSNSTRTTIKRTIEAEKLGVQCVLLVTPYYNKPTQEGLYHHFKAVAEACPNVEIILYNVPGRTGIDMLPETTIRLVKDFPNIIGTKEASGVFERYEQFAKEGKDFALFTGEDHQACAAVLAGARGVISVTANVAPKAVAAMIKAAREGKVEEAHRIDASLQPLHSAVFCEPSPAPAKFALADAGLIEEGIRQPLLPLTEQKKAGLREAAKKAYEAC